MSKYANSNRRFQDITFTVKNVKGKKLEELIGVEELQNPDRGPVSIFCKVENTNWVEYYFDVCYGTWYDYETQKWKEVEIDEEEYSYNDYAEKFGVKNQVVKSAYCKDNEIILEFETDEKLVFRCKNPDEWDGDYEMVKISG